MSKRPTLTQFTKYTLFVLAVVQLLFHTSLLTRGEEYFAAALSVDDTYYYLQPAWNLKQFGFVTFDGIHETNGVQLLWFGVVALLARVVQSKVALMYVSLATCFILNSACYFVIWKLGELLKRPTVSLLLAGLWSVQSFSRATFSIGMENSLHALVLWFVIWQILVFLLRVQNDQPPNFLPLTIMLILNAWTRFDSGLTSVVLYLCCVLTLASHSRSMKVFFRKNVKPIVGSSILAGLGLILQLAVFWVMGNSYLPVSGLVKSSGAGFEWGWEFIARLVRVSAASLTDSSPWRFSLATVGLIGIISLVKSHKSAGLRAYRGLWRCLAISWLIHHTVIVKTGVLGDADNFFWYPWYNTPWTIFWMITITLTVEMIGIVGQTKDQASWPSYRGMPITPRRVYRWIVVGLSLMVIALSGRHFWIRAGIPPDQASLYGVRYRAAIWMSENLPVDSVSASWNAGQLGFFSDRTVVNLDGLINSIDYYDRVLQGPVSLEDYLHENHVEYIVDYVYGNRVYRRLSPHVDDGQTPALKAIHTFPQTSSGEVLQVWELPSSSGGIE